MAIYHCTIKIGSRSSGRSAVAAAAYRSGSLLIEDETAGKQYDYSRKGGVIHSEIMLPDHAPTEFSDRSALWNSVQKVEKAKNAQLFREVEVALPVEISFDQQLDAVRRYVRDNFVAAGMCADIAIHDKQDGNPHAHILLTTRPLKQDGSWGQKEKKVYKLDADGNKIPVIDPETGQQKLGKRNCKQWVREKVETTNWNDRSNAEKWRASWADICNSYLDQDHQIDHRSYAEQGMLQQPTKHVGVTQKAMQEKGKQLDYDVVVKNIMITDYNTAVRRMISAIVEFFEKWKQRMEEIYERFINVEKHHEHYARQHGAAGEHAVAVGTDRERKPGFAGRVRKLDEIMRDAAETNRTIADTDQEIEELASIEAANDERIKKIIERRNAQLAGRSADDVRQRALAEYAANADLGSTERDYPVSAQRDGKTGTGEQQPARGEQRTRRRNQPVKSGAEAGAKANQQRKGKPERGVEKNRTDKERKSKRNKKNKGIERER